MGGGRKGERESPKFLEVSEGRAEFCLTRLQTQQASKLTEALHAPVCSQLVPREVLWCALDILERRDQSLHGVASCASARGSAGENDDPVQHKTPLLTEATSIRDRRQQMGRAKVG